MHPIHSARKFNLFLRAHGDEERARDKDGRVDAGHDSDEKRENEILEVGGADEVEREKNKDERERSIDGTRDGLVHAVVHDVAELFLAAAQEQIFADAVENHDRVVHRKAHHDEKRDNGVRIDLHTVETAEEDKHAGRNGNVMNEREKRDPAVFPRAYRPRCLAERKRDIERNTDKDKQNRDDDVLFERGADGRADGLEAQFVE